VAGASSSSPSITPGGARRQIVVMDVVMAAMRVRGRSWHIGGLALLHLPLQLVNHAINGGIQIVAALLAAQHDVVAI
jgi:hypothetical protein